jgi:uncharacterized protein YfiM (DUF2279 family)
LNVLKHFTKKYNSHKAPSARGNFFCISILNLSLPYCVPKTSLFLYCLLFSYAAFSQDTLTSTKQINKKRFRAVYIGGATLYGVTLLGLNEVWYKENPRSGFHFFNDQREWKQIDKAGHFYSAYHLSHSSAKIFRWTGMPARKAIWLGSITGIIFLTPVEILDGFSAAYGASWSDLLANAAGSALSLQSLFWEKPRIHPKFSFHRTRFAPLRPNVLGENFVQEIVKDYNGQTYWLAFDIQPWLGKQSKFPKWINLAFGYGAQNMVFANASDNMASGFPTYRQYYLSLDVNLTNIPTKNKFLKSLFFALNTIHFPAPAIEFNKKRISLHPVYF